MKTFHSDECENSDQFQFFGGSAKGAEVNDSFAEIINLISSDRATEIAWMKRLPKFSQVKFNKLKNLLTENLKVQSSSHLICRTQMAGRGD